MQEKKEKTWPDKLYVLKIDIGLLKKQRNALLQAERDKSVLTSLQGVVNLLEDIMDQAEGFKNPLQDYKLVSDWRCEKCRLTITGITFAALAVPGTAACPECGDDRTLIGERIVLRSLM